MAVAFFSLPADDAYIVARYAMQVAAGHGIVYNEGEFINALTSPMHLGVLLVLQPLAGAFVTLYRAICAFAVAAVLLTFAHRAWGRSRTAAHFLGLTLACPFVAFWTVGGMETPLLLCVCTAVAFLALHGDARHAQWIVALAAAAVLIRYDASLFVAPVALYTAWRRRRDARVRIAALCGALAVLAWSAFTLRYFGDLLPTSFYVKAGHAPGARELGRGTLYVASFLCLTWIWLAVPTRMRPRAAAERALGLGLALTFGYALFASTVHMMYGFRLLVPFLPATAAMLLASGGALADRSRAAFPALLAWQAGLAAFIYFYSANPSLALLVEGTSDASEQFEFSHLGARHTRAFLATAEGQAEAIRKHWAATGAASTRAPRVVVSTGGMLPYLLPESYVFEQLVSYRHRCKPALEPLADYAQVIYDETNAEAIEGERIRQGREVIARFTLTADGLRAKPLPLAVEIWYRPSRAPNPLPSKAGEPCKA
ncbi:MAG TPA: hypothetical protein VMN56_00340 [Casimicrobiaceae bacterium]|nr:hypothetical protein [Casimicrobiaceae bacterium]